MTVHLNYIAQASSWRLASLNALASKHGGAYAELLTTLKVTDGITPDDRFNRTATQLWDICDGFGFSIVNLDDGNGEIMNQWQNNPRTKVTRNMVQTLYGDQSEGETLMHHIFFKIKPYEITKPRSLLSNSFDRTSVVELERDHGAALLQPEYSDLVLEDEDLTALAIHI